MNISVYHSSKTINCSIPLPSSKSESNRALIINALSGNKCDIQNISEARDTVTMNRLLQSNDETLDVIDAGTTMRFLTAFSTLSSQDKILTGTERMCERPIGILVDALREIGADIEYLKQEGYPPIKVKGIKSQKTNKITVRGDVSSQFISALLMIAPNLSQGLTLELSGEIGSRPYIEMTLQMMRDFGIEISKSWDRTISIAHQPYKAAKFYVESDWSGASYWYGITSIAENAEIELIGLKKYSLQGDAAIVQIMEKLGISTEYKQHSVILRKTNNLPQNKEIKIDFAHCPDIAQTIAVICAAKGIRLLMTGVESLKVKETDRLAALKNELKKFNIDVNDLGNQSYEVSNATSFEIEGTPFINTYKDHRMAMAFAPIALLGKIEIESKDVVVKSYPSFWNHLQIAGFEMN
jgi:3-phosphoshikimate 1-carboxyvinyltransferase